MKFTFSRLIFIFIFTNNLIMANDGDLDPSFGTGGKVTTTFTGFSFAFADSVIEQADGKLVAAGSVSAFVNSDFAIVRYETNGSVDTSFGTNGQVLLNLGNPSNIARQVRQQGTGKLIVAGSSGDPVLPGATSFAIIRLNTDGSQDLTFGSAGSTLTTFLPGRSANSAYGMALLPGDGFVVAGTTSNLLASVNPLFAVATYNSNGILQHQTTISFTASASDSNTGRAVAVSPDGKIIVAGYLTPSTSTPSCRELFAIARLNSDLTPDATFGSGGLVTFCFNVTGSTNNSHAYSVAVQQDGKIVIAGTDTNNNTHPSTTQFAVARLTANGTLDSSFNGTGQILFNFGGTDDEASSVAIQRDGKIVVGGFTNVAGFNEFALARLTTSGSLDPLFGAGGQVITSFGTSGETVSTIIQSDGKIVAAGQSKESSTTPYSFALARYLASIAAPCISPADALTIAIRNKYITAG